MYFNKLHYHNIKDLGNGSIDFSDGNLTVKKWNFISYGNSMKGPQLLRLAAISLCGTKHISYFVRRPGCFLNDKEKDGWIEPVLLRHSLKEKISNSSSYFGTRYTFTRKAPIILFRENIKKDGIYYMRNLKFGNENTDWFACGFGPSQHLNLHKGSLEFESIRHRALRFITLFRDNARLTPVVAWLHRRYLNTYRFRLGGSKKIFEETSKLINNIFQCEYLDVTSEGHFLMRPRVATKGKQKVYLENLPQQKKKIIAILIDLIRHISDAHPYELNPLCKEGVVLFDRIDNGLSTEDTKHLFSCIDESFPNLQFILSVNKKKNCFLNTGFFDKVLTVPGPDLTKPVSRKNIIIGRNTIVLVDVDSRIPNLALMKLSRYYKKLGKKVILEKHKTNINKPEKVIASSVFYQDASQKKLSLLRKVYADRLELGGSGVSLEKRLPSKIESLMPDYSIYPENDRAIGFITRGCNLSCRFCIVPKKEGELKQVAKFTDFVEQGQDKVVLLDDNLMAFNGVCEILETILQKKYQVNFNQTLDLRYLTPEIAKLFRLVDSRNYNFTSTYYYFSINLPKNLELYREKFELLNLPVRKQATFVCMYGFKNSLAEDLRMYKFIQSLKGPSVFVQKYMPALNDPNLSFEPETFFDDDAEYHINQLIKIVFGRNMKSMEKYYRWLNLLYTKKFRKIHNPLVDTIFRYNKRYLKAHYVEKLKNICNNDRGETGCI